MISPLDHHLLRAYLDGEMDAETTQAFEIRMIERPELAEFVDADSALGIGLRAGEKPAVSSGATVVTLPAASPAPPVRRVAHIVPFLAAAAALLAVGVGVGRLLQPQLDTPLYALATNVSIDKMRGGPDDAVKLPASGGVIVAVPAVRDVKGCPVHIRISQGNVALAFDAMPGDDDDVYFVADASRLSSGPAVFTVGCVGSDSPAVYEVEFVR